MKVFTILAVAIIVGICAIYKEEMEKRDRRKEKGK